VKPWRTHADDCGFNGRVLALLVDAVAGMSNEQAISYIDDLVDKSPEFYAQKIWKQMRGVAADESGFRVASELISRLYVFDAQYSPEMVTLEQTFRAGARGHALLMLFSRIQNTGDGEMVPKALVLTLLAAIGKVLEPHWKKLEASRKRGRDAVGSVDDVLVRNLFIKHEYLEGQKRGGKGKMALCEEIALRYHVDASTVRELCGLKVRKDRILGSTARRSPQA
jgi:hypothetical protein